MDSGFGVCLSAVIKKDVFTCCDKLCSMISTKTDRSNIWVLGRLKIYFYQCCALGQRLKPRKSRLRMSMAKVTVVITGFCQTDKVNLRLIHIRQTEVLFQFQANNYHLPDYQQAKDGSATDSCFVPLLGHIRVA